VAQAVSRRPPTAAARLDPVSVHVGFVVEKVALGQIFPRLLRFSTGAPLLGKMKKLIIPVFILIITVAQKTSRLRSVRSFCCGALLHEKSPLYLINNL
jgi:hypothetical protein